MNRASRPSQVASFEDVFETSVKESVRTLLGDIVLKSISFYFDSKILIRDPNRFVDAFRGLFGNTASMVEKLVREDLGTKMNVPADKQKSLDFRAFVKIAKSQFSSKYPAGLKSSP